jgi:hypothetical protein
LYKQITVLCVVGCLGVIGCGGEGSASDPQPRHPITAVVEELQASFADRDVARICRLMTRAGAVEAGNVAHSTPTTCEKDVKKVFGMIDKGGGWLDAGTPRVAAVEEDGDKATAVLDIDGWRATVPFERDDGDWKIASFIGMGAELLAAVQKDGREEAFASRGKGVRISTYGGYTCPPLLSDAYPKITGGCEIRVSDSGPVPVEMATPYGAFKFGDCFVDYRILADEQGRTWTDEWKVEGSGKSGCSDVGPCFDQRPNGRVDLLPWAGRIVAGPDGELLHRTRMCVRTCIGMFAGEFVTRLVRDGDRWRIEPTDAGATGFKLDAPLDVYGLPFQIKAASAA